MNPHPSKSGSRKARLVSLLLAAAVVALAPAQADAASMYVHSAESGELSGGRLILRGVGRDVTWTTSSGRAGVERVTRVHRRLILPKKPATGTLHIAGQRGGDELTFRLSQPRYHARSGSVSYRAEPISKRARAAAARASAAATRSFGSASLSVAAHASVASGSNGGNDCQAVFLNNTWYGMEYVSSAKWDTDTWENDSQLKDGTIVPSVNLAQSGFYGGWESDGGLWRGCANHTVWKLVPSSYGAPPEDVVLTFNLEWDWGNLPAFDCGSSNPRFICEYDGNERHWIVRDRNDPWDPGD